MRAGKSGETMLPGLSKTPLNLLDAIVAEHGREWSRPFTEAYVQWDQKTQRRALVRLEQFQLVQLDRARGSGRIRQIRATALAEALLQAFYDAPTNNFPWGTDD